LDGHTPGELYFCTSAHAGVSSPFGEILSPPATQALRHRSEGPTREALQEPFRAKWTPERPNGLSMVYHYFLHELWNFMELPNMIIYANICHVCGEARTLWPYGLVSVAESSQT